jgi:hypothetical protein
MPSGQHPAASSAGDTFVVEFKSDNSGATTGREAENLNAIFAPPEMFVPDLSTWVK